jgi:hypothetical protein
MRFLWWNDVEGGELVCNCREETVAIWIDLFHAYRGLK